jgi:hypothetical protein
MILTIFEFHHGVLDRLLDELLDAHVNVGVFCPSK